MAASFSLIANQEANTWGTSMDSGANPRQVLYRIPRYVTHTNPQCRLITRIAQFHYNQRPLGPEFMH